MKYLKLYEDYTNSDFLNWFGDSLVVDSNGLPLIVYHGTAEKFDMFDTSKIGQNYNYSEKSGFFFTQKEQSAKNYAHLHTGGKSAGHVISAYLRILNPIIRNTNSDYYTPADVFDMRGHELMREVRNDKSIDGIIIRGTRNDDLYIVFKPNQIKIINHNE